MSVHWKPTGDGNCPHCGRIVVGSCICPDSHKSAKAKEPEKGHDVPFWSLDHFGIMPRFKNEGRR